MTLSDHMIEGIKAMDEFMREQEKIVGVKLLDKLPIIYRDNVSTISLVTKGSRRKNQAIKVGQVLGDERCDRKDFEIAYIKASNIITEVLTKPMDDDTVHMMALLLLNIIVTLCKLLNQCLDNMGAMNSAT